MNLKAMAHSEVPTFQTKMIRTTDLWASCRIQNRVPHLNVSFTVHLHTFRWHSPQYNSNIVTQNIPSNILPKKKITSKKLYLAFDLQVFFDFLPYHTKTLGPVSSMNTNRGSRDSTATKTGSRWMEEQPAACTRYRRVAWVWKVM